LAIKFLHMRSSHNQNKILVSVVVLNWNGDRHVHKCVEYVLAQTYRPLEIIIVDNASTDDSLAKLRAKFPQLIYKINSVNIGFAAGMNRGISLSKGEFVVPLNQDVCLHPEFIRRCVDRIKSEDSIGAIGGRVFAWIGDDLTEKLRQYEGELTYFRKRFQGRGGIKLDNEAYVFTPSGSFPFLRRKMLDDLNSISGCYFDEDYETGWEDADLFFRMHLRGWRCLFLPSASGWHVGSGSVGGKARLMSKKTDYQKRIFRNRYFTIIKDLPGNILLWLLPYLAIVEFALIPYLVVRSPKSLLALASAWREIYRNFPALMAKRRAIQSNVLVEKNYLKQFFVKF